MESPQGSILYLRPNVGKQTNFRKPKDGRRLLKVVLYYKKRTVCLYLYQTKPYTHAA